MLKVERKVFEGVVTQVVTSTDVRELIREFSLYRVFFYSLLRDVSRGKDSPNYYILEKVARDRKISEQFIIEQIKFVLSLLAPDEPKEDYYETLNLPPTASTEEIRDSWLNLMKVYHPDRVGDTGLNITKRLNEAYEVLRDPIKRSEYDARRFPELHVVVKSFWAEMTSRRLIYSVPAVLVLSIFALYLVGPGSLFRSDKGETEVAKNRKENKLLSPQALPSKTVNGIIPFEHEKPGVKEVAAYPSKESKGILTVEKKAETSEEKGEASKLQGASMPAMKKPSKSQKQEGEEAEPLKEGGKISQTEEKPERLKGNKYAVGEGESLWRIAKEFNTSVKDLKEVNNLKGNHLDVGDVLIIPDVNRKGVVTRDVVKGEEGEKTTKELAKDVVVKKVSLGGDKKFEQRGIRQEPGVTKRAVEKSEAQSGFSYPDKTSLYLFVSQYVSAYKNRDINGILSLFESGAKENGNHMSKVISSYRSNFSSFEVVRYDVRIRGVDFKDDRASVDGDFIVTFKKKGERTVKSSRGTIGWLLSWQGDKWRIKELNYEIKNTALEDKGL